MNIMLRLELRTPLMILLRFRKPSSLRTVRLPLAESVAPTLTGRTAFRDVSERKSKELP